MLETAKAEKETLENAGLKVNVEFGEIKKPQAKVEASAGSSSQSTTVIKTVKVPANGGKDEAAAEGDSKKEKEPKDNGENEAAAPKSEAAPAAEEAPKENDMLEFLAV